MGACTSTAATSDESSLPKPHQAKTADGKPAAAAVVGVPLADASPEQQTKIAWSIHATEKENSRQRAPPPRDEQQWENVMPVTNGMNQSSPQQPARPIVFPSSSSGRASPLGQRPGHARSMSHGSPRLSVSKNFQPALLVQPVRAASPAPGRSGSPAPAPSLSRQGSAHRPIRSLSIRPLADATHIGGGSHSPHSRSRVRATEDDTGGPSAALQNLAMRSRTPERAMSLIGAAPRPESPVTPGGSRPQHQRRPSLSVSANERQMMARQQETEAVLYELAQEQVASPTQGLGLKTGGTRAPKAEVPLAQQILQRNALATTGAAEIPASPGSRNRSASPSHSRNRSMPMINVNPRPDRSPSVSDFVPASGGVIGGVLRTPRSSVYASPSPRAADHSAALDFPAVGIMHDPSTETTPVVPFAPRVPISPVFDGMSARKKEEMRCEELWAHYAGEKHAHMHKSGLYTLAADVLEEFKARLRKILHAQAEEANAKRGPSSARAYTAELCEADLQRELPFLLPVRRAVGSNGPPTHDEYVQHICRFAMREMKASVAGGGGRKAAGGGSDSPVAGGRASPSPMLVRAQTPTDGSAPLRLSRLEFISGWTRCHASLFKVLDAFAKENEHKNSGDLCKLM